MINWQVPVPEAPHGRPRHGRHARTKMSRRTIERILRDTERLSQLERARAEHSAPWTAAARSSWYADGPPAGGQRGSCSGHAYGSAQTDRSTSQGRA